jgi:hypothetical protein
MAGRIAYTGGIVTNGLVLNLDAAKRDSYPGSGTSWRDIVSNTVTGSLINGPTFNSNNGGGIVFDGTDDRVSQTTAINAGDNFTVGAWVYPTAMGVTRRAVIGNSYNYSTRRGWFFCVGGGGVSNAFFLSIGSDNAYKITPADTLSTNTWVYITATCQNGGSSIDLYKNGTLISGSFASLLTSGNISYDINQFNIGLRLVGGTADPYTGNIAQVSIYNRALTASEVLQNYNSLKSRFGLT